MQLTPVQLRENVLEFLRDNHVMHVATTDGIVPIASVLVYVVDDQCNFYFLTFQHARKVVHLEKNNNISLAVWEHNTMLVEVEGTASLIEDVERKRELVQALAEVATHEARFWPPIFRIDDTEHLLYKITPERMRMLDVTKKALTHSALPFVEVALRD